jgi:nicotinamide mononucleotide transporter
MNWALNAWTSIAAYLTANWTELAGFVTTCVGIWLTTKRWLICWPVVLAADIFYLVVFYHARLFSDTLLQLFFIGFTLYGWWFWWRGVRAEGEVKVVPLSWWGWAWGLAAGAAGAIVLAWLMIKLSAMLHISVALPRLDATLTSYSLVASWWQARKHTANWWLWIAIDGVYIGEYAYKALWLTAFLSVVLVALAVLGLRDWRRAANGTIQTAA